MNSITRCKSEPIHFEYNDSDCRSLQETQDSGVEYVLSPDTISLSRNYFFSRPLKSDEKIEISLEGRKIQVFGLNETDSSNEFTRAFGDIIHPVVDVKALAKVVDRCISNELMKIFDQLTPVFPERSLDWNSSFCTLNRDETIQVASEINHFDSDFPTQGELRLAVERIPSAKAKRYILNRYAPIITAQEIDVVRTSMKIKKMKKTFLSLVSPDFRPYEIKKALDSIPLEYINYFKALSVLLHKRIQAFETLSKQDYSPVYTIEFVLGEELYKRIFKNLPICWRLPKGNVPHLHQLIDYQKKKFQEVSAGDDQNAPIVFFGNVDLWVLKKISETFFTIKDYIIEEEFLPTLLPIIHMPLNPWPRIERVKQAFRIYVRIERLMYSVTDEMFQILETIKTNSQRELIGKLLEDSKTKEEQLNVLKPFISQSHFSIEEQDDLIELLLKFVPFENEILIDAMLISSKSKNEIIELAKEILKKLESNQISLLISQFEELHTLSEKQKLLQSFGVNVNLSSSDMDELLDFLVLNDLPEYKRSVREDLIGLEEAARQTLDEECRSAGVRIVFTQRGREVAVGSVEMDFETNQISPRRIVIAEEDSSGPIENGFEIIENY